MFPLQQSDELLFKISSNPHQQHKILQDLIMSQSHASKDIITSMEKSRRRKLCVMGSTATDEFCSDKNNSSGKKMMHRDIERQRRQEMATLYKSLRSLLPLEFIKGKRSITAHVNEAVNLIKHLQRNIKELGAKRDELKNLSDLSAHGSASGRNSSSCVVISPSLVGVEIALSCGLGAQGLCLSKVLEAVLEEGLSVINCVSSKVDDRLLHIIQTEINDPARFNLSLLQQKITQME